MQLEGITNGSNFRIGETASALAFALVLQSDAQDVRHGSYPGKAPDARPGTRLGKHRYGGRPRPEATLIVTLYSIGESADSGASRLPILNRH
jgi:hypothetical protein